MYMYMYVHLYMYVLAHAYHLVHAHIHVNTVAIPYSHRRFNVMYTEIRCPEAPTIANTAIANYTRTSHNSGGYPVNTTLTYACDDGYRFIDGSTVDSLVCDVTGQWGGIDSYGDGTIELCTFNGGCHRTCIRLCDIIQYP